MTAVEIKISAKKAKVITKKGNTVLTKSVQNENIAYCIEQYVSAGNLVSMSVTEKGNADVLYTAFNRMSNVFNLEECVFGNELMILVKSPKLTTV